MTMTADAGDSAREEVEGVVRQTIAAIMPAVPAAAVTGGKHLKDLGADSVDRVEIVLALIDRLGIDEPMAAFSAIPDIDSLTDFLTKARRQ
jgi:polyketide biosynthesis acyl carrier protein